MPIADSTADHILAAFVYHEVESQAELMAECARVLKRGGVLTVIDFQKIAEDEGPPMSVRKSPEHVKKASSKWFKLVSSDGTKGYYQLMFSKR
jgi:ubiquinone/menaquinone biosynthesis C-methylase UbiE